MRFMDVIWRYISSIFTSTRQTDSKIQLSSCEPEIVKKREIQYITVFPFESLSSDAGCSFIGYGIAEALYSKLSQVSGLHVIERSQLLSVVEKLNDGSSVITDPSRALKLGMTFGARIVVYGSFQRTGNFLEITAVLASYNSTLPVSHREVSGEYADIFNLQSELALSIVSASGIPISGIVISALNRPEHISIDEYEWNARGIQSVDIDRGDEAIACFNKAISLNGDETDLFLNLAIAYGCNGDYINAIRNFELSINLNPNCYRAYNNRGAVYNRMGDYDRALSDYNKTINLNPEYPAAYNNRGSVYYRKHDYERAIQDFSKAIRLNPDYALAYYNRGVAYSLRHDYHSAISDYSIAISLNQDYSSAYNNRGVAYGNIGNDDQAIADYNKAINLNPNYYTAYNNRGNLYLKKGDFNMALDDYSKTISLNPHSSEAYCNRANVYYMNGDKNQAIAEYTKAINLNCDYYGAFLNRGFVYEEIGDKESAYNDFRKAMELDCRQFQELSMSDKS